MGLLVNVYLPTPTKKNWREREDLDRNLKEFLVDYKDNIIAVVGDFNTTLSKLDEACEEGHSFVKGKNEYFFARERMKHLMFAADLEDPLRYIVALFMYLSGYNFHYLMYRAANVDRAVYTSCQIREGKNKPAARVDFILVPKSPAKKLTVRGVGVLFENMGFPEYRGVSLS